MIHYHYASNANLIYALVRAHARIERLATFSLARGIADIRRTRGLAGAPPSNDGAAAGRTRRENDRAPSGEENSDRKEAIEPPASELSPSQDEKARHEAAELEAISKLSVQEQRSESPSDPAAAQNGHASAPSEKARGKMRETGSAPHSIDGGETVSLADTEPDLSPEELAAAAAAVGKNGFVASQEWVTSWQKG